jgi:hypothetical protein
MKPSCLPTASCRTLELALPKAALAALPSKDTVVELRRHLDEWEVRVEGSWHPAALANPKAIAPTEEELLRTVFWLARGPASGSDAVLVAASTFAGALPRDEELVFAIDEAFLADLRKNFRVSDEAATAIPWLQDHVLAQGTGEQFAVAARIANVDADGAPTQLFLLGNGIAIEVRATETGYRCFRTVRKGIARSTGLLLRGAIRFSDATQTGAAAMLTRAALESAVRSNGSYLSIWQAYNDLERDKTLARARAFGAVRYDAREKVETKQDKVWRFTLADAEDSLAAFGTLPDGRETQLQATSEPPDLDATDTPGARGKDRANRTFEGLFGSRRFDRERRTVDLPADSDDDMRSAPPERGYLSLSLRGEWARQDRQRRAAERIRNGQCPMPWLGLRLEGQAASAPRHKRHPAMTPKVAASFDAPLNASQIHAIDVALNTPDIALIQGPPGTGKTKVITALQRRIVEILAEEQDVMHKVLVTSTQHEAVDNVARRSSVYGLPPSRVGGGNRRRDLSSAPLESYRAKMVEELKADLGSLPDADRADRARRAALLCLRTTTTRAASIAALTDLLEATRGLVRPETSDQLWRRIRTMQESVFDERANDPDTKERQRQAVRGIRTDPAPFSDDGPVRAAVALRMLDGVLAPAERDLLTRCRDWKTNTTPDFLAQLEPMKERLLGILETPPAEITGVIDADTESLLRTTIQELQLRREASLGKEGPVLAEWLNELEYDPEGVRTMLERYAAVMASTLQHADSPAMMDARNLVAGTGTFDTVLVDEAARSHPLDLLIPMSMTKRRIVLVGDQRQLPHMLEPDIEREFQSRSEAGDDVAAETAAALRESLFARLWQHLKELERQGAPPRTASLDEQYRMHPLLGAFVSRTFYEPSVILRSGAGTQRYVHSFANFRAKSGAPAVACWVDVPGGPGAEEVRDASKHRPAEARVVATEVKALLAASTEVSIGVIAFYARQVESIYAELSRHGITERDADGEWRIASPFQGSEDALGRRIERLRIGTVDAFQGREFDVVFLSVTRSNGQPAATEAERRRKYGHLLLPNRMCVAMSRQHRLLVAVGDQEFARQSPILALKGFLDLCEGPHGIVR